MWGWPCAAPDHARRDSHPNGAPRGSPVRRFEACWPALRKDASGIVLCFNASDEAQLHALDMW